MKPSEQYNMDQLIEMEVERDEMGAFERQFRDPERGNWLRKGLAINEVFEKAGYKPMKWEEISLWLHPSILNGFRKRCYGISARPWEQGQMIFGNPDEGNYYFVQKSGKDYSWSRLWIEGETLRIEPMNHDSNLSEVITTVAYHRYAERRESGVNAAAETREKAREALRPRNPRYWERK